MDTRSSRAKAKASSEADEEFVDAPEAPQDEETESEDSPMPKRRDEDIQGNNSGNNSGYASLSESDNDSPGKPAGKTNAKSTAKERPKSNPMPEESERRRRPA